MGRTADTRRAADARHRSRRINRGEVHDEAAGSHYQARLGIGRCFAMSAIRRHASSELKLLALRLFWRWRSRSGRLSVDRVTYITKCVERILFRGRYSARTPIRLLSCNNHAYGSSIGRPKTAGP